MRTRKRSLILATIGAIPAAVIAIFSLQQSIPKFVDPCLEWGIAPVASTHGERQGEFTRSLPPSPQSTAAPSEPAGCIGHQGATTETQSEATWRLIWVSGGLLAAAITSITGVLSWRPFLIILGSILLFLESIVILSLAPLTFLASLFLLWAALDLSRTKSRLAAVN